MVINPEVEQPKAVSGGLRSVTRRVKVHSTERVFDGFFKIDEATVSYERFDGQMSPQLSRLVFERGDSVSAFVYNTESRKVVLVNQFKYPVYTKGSGWITETVAGMIDGDETPEEALRREIVEEIGYVVSNVEHISTFYVSPGGSSERILLYYAEVVSSDKVGPGGGVRSENEDIEVVEIDVDELNRRLAAGEIEDAKTIIGAMWFLSRYSDQ